MKKIKYRLKMTSIKLLVGIVAGIIYSSCVSNLLDQQPTVDPGEDTFWKTESDALYALMGAYSSIRPLFDRDYYYDGQGEYVRTRSATNSTSSSDLQLGLAYRSANYNPIDYAGSFDNMFKYLYGGVNRANYVIEGIENYLLPYVQSDASRENIEAILAEARLLRGMVYFRLISMWGDVPYFDKVIGDNSEVADISRTPIAEIKKHIQDDFDYAVEKLPNKASAVGRAGKPAALAFRGKLNLYWGCWNKFGWPELDGFTPSATEASTAYRAAIDDFGSVINDFNLTLYKDGDPGEIDELGKADKLPNYYYLFTPLANGDPEMLMVFTHGGTNSDQSEELMRDFAGRSLESSQCWVSPRYEIADRYQSVITGDFCDPLIPSTNKTLLNSAINPQSYANRDYRMKATIMWDYEMCIGMSSLKSTGWVPFIYKTWNSVVDIDGVNYTTYNTDGTNSGYVFRKFVRNYAGQGRSSGDYNWPVMRLADVYLMYAEAVNEMDGPQPAAIEVVNKVRHRGNLPQLSGGKTADKASFFSAIEQERIVELVGEGHRGFDLRRWRAIERVWCPPYGDGVQYRDTRGANVVRYFQNKSELTYQRCYIFKIPESERNRNPNLTQNTPWL